MDYNSRKTYPNENDHGTLQHDYPFNEGVEINTRHDRDYSNHEKAVTQPTPSSDKARE